MTFQSAEKDWFNIDIPKPENVIRIVVSHMPILPVPDPMFSRNVMKKLQPSVIFSAHDHRGLDYATLRKADGGSEAALSRPPIGKSYSGRNSAFFQSRGIAGLKNVIPRDTAGSLIQVKDVKTPHFFY